MKPAGGGWVERNLRRAQEGGFYEKEMGEQYLWPLDWRLVCERQHFTENGTQSFDLKETTVYSLFLL